MGMDRHRERLAHAPAIHAQDQLPLTPPHKQTPDPPTSEKIGRLRSVRVCCTCARASTNYEPAGTATSSSS